MAGLPMMVDSDKTGPSTTPPEPAERAVAAIVRDVMTGNEAAFEELVFLYRDQVHATAWQITRDADDAMDVAQEVFVRVYRALGSFRGNARFSTWLHRIILNTCMDYLRREKRHRQGRVEMEGEAQEGEKPRRIEGVAPPRQREEASRHEVQARVLTALNQISARQREVFLLRYYNDLSVEEIGEVLRCSAGSVKRHLFRAQERLRDLLKDLKAR